MDAGYVCECKFPNVYASAQPVWVYIERIWKCIGRIGQSKAYIAAEHCVPV